MHAAPCFATQCFVTRAVELLAANGTESATRYYDGGGALLTEIQLTKMLKLELDEGFQPHHPPFRGTVRGARRRHDRRWLRAAALLVLLVTSTY